MMYSVSWLIGWYSHWCIFSCYDDLVFISLFSERNIIGSIMYVFFPPIILLGINFLIHFDVFSLDRITFYMRLYIVDFFILYRITSSLGMFSSLYVPSIGFYSVIWCHGLVKFFAYVDLTCGIYYPCGSVRSLITHMSFLDILSCILRWHYCLQIPFLKLKVNIFLVWNISVELLVGTFSLWVFTMIISSLVKVVAHLRNRPILIFLFIPMYIIIAHIQGESVEIPVIPRHFSMECLVT